MCSVQLTERFLLKLVTVTVTVTVMVTITAVPRLKHGCWDLRLSLPFPPFCHLHYEYPLPL